MLFIWLHFQFIFYDYYFTILLFIFSVLFILYFKFTFVPFFFICFLFCHFSFLVLQMSPSGASFACYYFYFYPYLPLVNSPRRTPRPSALPGNFMSLYLSLCLYYGYWAGQFHFSPPLYHCIQRASPELNLAVRVRRSHPIHPPGGAWEWGCLPPDPLTRSRFCNKRDFYFEYFTFHLLGRRSLIHLHHHRHHCPLPLISSSSSRSNIIQWVVNHFSTRRDDAPEDNTYMSLGKRDDTASKVSEGFHRMKVELPWPPFSPLDFLQFEHMLCPFNSMKKALRSSLIFLSA